MLFVKRKVCRWHIFNTVFILTEKKIDIYICKLNFFFLNVNYKFVNQYPSQSEPEVTVHVKLTVNS